MTRASGKFFRKKEVKMARTPDQIVTDYEALATKLVALNEEARALINDEVPPEPPDGDVIFVPEGDKVQEALDAAFDGAIVELAQGATFAGRLTIKKPVTLRTQGITVEGRVTPEQAGGFAILPDGLKINPSVNDVNLQKLYIGGKELNDIVEIGAGDADQSNADQQPTRIVIDQCFVMGHKETGAKRGIAAQGRDVVIRQSHIADIFRAGQDTQCIGGWNGEGPFVIDDCYLAAAGENVMFGGSAPNIQGCIPSDITIMGCTIEKPMEWKGSTYTIKNLIEFKSGRRIHIHHNIIRNMWPAGQAYALVITPSQYGDEPENTVEDYVFEFNEVTNIANGFNILGHGQNQNDRPTQTSQRITIRENWFQISRKTLGGNGWFVMIGNGPKELVIENNTIQTDGPVYIQGNSPGQNPGTPGFVFRGNIVQNIGDYGTSLNYNGTDQKRGKYWREYFAPDGIMQDNAYCGDKGEFKTNFPDDLHVSVAEGASLVDSEGYGVGVFAPFGRTK
jgi:hypothetical protein